MSKCPYVYPDRENCVYQEREGYWEPNDNFVCTSSECTFPDFDEEDCPIDQLPFKDSIYE